MSMIPMMEIMVNKVGISSVLLAKNGFMKRHNVFLFISLQQTQMNSRQCVCFIWQISRSYELECFLYNGNVAAWRLKFQA